MQNWLSWSRKKSNEDSVIWSRENFCYNLCYNIWKLLKTNCFGPPGARTWRARTAAGPGRPEPQNSRSLRSRRLVRGLGATQAGCSPGKRKKLRLRDVTSLAWSSSAVWPHILAPWVTYGTLVPALQQMLNRDEQQQTGLSLMFPVWPHPSTSGSRASLCPQSQKQEETFPVLPVYDYHQLQLPAGHQAGYQIEQAECTIRMNDAPTMGSSADVCNKTTWSWGSVFCVLPRPREFITDPQHSIQRLGSPHMMQKLQDSLARLTSAQAWCSSTESGAVPPAVTRTDLTTSSGVRQARPWGEDPFVVEHRLAHYGDCGGVMWPHVLPVHSPHYCNQRSFCGACPTATMSLRGPVSVTYTYIQNEHSLKGNHHCVIMENGVFLSLVVGNHLLPAFLDLDYPACGTLMRDTGEVGLHGVSDRGPSPSQSRPGSEPSRLELWRGYIIQAFVDVSLSQIGGVGPLCG